MVGMWAVLALVSMLSVDTGVLACQSRSGEDGDRVYSHQGTEPSYDKERENVVVEDKAAARRETENRAGGGGRGRPDVMRDRVMRSEIG